MGISSKFITMITRSNRSRLKLLGFGLSGLLLMVPAANAWTRHAGSHGGGHGGHAPRGGFKAPRMPGIWAPGRSQGHVSHSNVAAGKANSGVKHGKTAVSAGHNLTASSAGTVHGGSASGAAVRGSAATNKHSSGIFVAGYTYGYGPHARHYRAFGYGSGYRNRYYGRRYGYGRSQSYNRAIVGRLRSVLGQLARLDHDYQGHRVRAMHSISMAIRQLSHRSMIYNRVGSAPGMSRGMGMGRGRAGAAGARGGRGRMSQAQSDARMSHALRTLQGVNMQLGGQGGYTMGHARARGHVLIAIQHLRTALSIR